MKPSGRIVLEGIGAAGGFGCGIDAFSRSLVESIPRPGTLSITTGLRPTEIPAFRADTSRLQEFLPLRTLRRIDHFSRLALLGSHLALADAGLDAAESGRMGVIVASGYGATGITYAFLKSFINDGDICASPTYFANSVHNSAAAHIAIHLAARGPCLTVSQFDLSVHSALTSARHWLLEGRVDRVLFGAVEELSELIGYAWCRMREVNRSGIMTPLQTRKESAIPAEGAAFLLFSREETARKAYCTLEEAITGSHPDADFPLPDTRLLLLGADGRTETGRRYSVIAKTARIACYSPVYGSLAAGPAFDLAAAALVMNGGIVFRSPGGEDADFPAVIPPAGSRFDGPTISCLALSGIDESFGLSTLGKL